MQAALSTMNSITSYLEDQNIPYQIKEKLFCIFSTVFQIKKQNFHIDSIIQVAVDAKMEPDYLYMDVLMPISFPDPELTQYALTLCNAINAGTNKGSFFVFSHDWDNRLLLKTGRSLVNISLNAQNINFLFNHVLLMVDKFYLTLLEAIENWPLKINRKSDTFLEIIGT